MNSIKKYLKFFFRILRSLDRRVVAALSLPSVFRPKVFLAGSESQLDAMQRYDYESFMKYSKSPKLSIFLRIYMGVRNKLFVRSYRMFRRLVR